VLTAAHPPPVEGGWLLPIRAGMIARWRALCQGDVGGLLGISVALVAASATTKIAPFGRRASRPSPAGVARGAPKPAKAGFGGQLGRGFSRRRRQGTDALSPLPNTLSLRTAVVGDVAHSRPEPSAAISAEAHGQAGGQGQGQVAGALALPLARLKTMRKMAPFSRVNMASRPAP